MTHEEALGAYATRAAEYAERFGAIEAADRRDRALVESWAAAVGGPVLDVGCGPGQWTAAMHAGGADVVGIEPVEAFLEIARRSNPAARFRQGRAESLDAADASVGGVLAWYSLVHHTPGELDAALMGLARVVRSGGSVLMGFFAGPAGVAFDHAVATAWTWSVDALTARLAAVGLDVVDHHLRADPGARRHGDLLAVRR